MTDSQLEKIVKFFKEIECPLEFAFKKNSDESSLQEYAVIYTGEDIMFCNKKNKKFEFEKRYEFEILAFYSGYFNKEKLLKMLEKRGYFLCNI